MNKVVRSSNLLLQSEIRVKVLFILFFFIEGLRARRLEQGSKAFICSHQLLVPGFFVLYIGLIITFFPRGEVAAIWVISGESERGRNRFTFGALKVFIIFNFKESFILTFDFFFKSKPIVIDGDYLGCLVSSNSWVYTSVQDSETPNSPPWPYTALQQVRSSKIPSFSDWINKIPFHFPRFSKYFWKVTSAISWLKFPFLCRLGVRFRFSILNWWWAFSMDFARLLFFLSSIEECLSNILSTIDLGFLGTLFLFLPGMLYNSQHRLQLLCILQNINFFLLWVKIDWFQKWLLVPINRPIWCKVACFITPTSEGWTFKISL